MDKERIEQQLKDFLLEEGWLENEEEFKPETDFRKDLEFTNREIAEMFFMLETEFDILTTTDDERQVRTIGGLVEMIAKKKSL